MHKSENDRFWLGFVGLLVLFTALYAALAGGSIVWADEAYTFAMLPHSFGEIWKITAADVHPPLYYFLLKIITAPFGYSLLAAKLAAVIPYVFILAFGGIQLRKLFGGKTGLLFMLLFFLFPFALSFSIEVRMYSWAAAFVFGGAVYGYRCFLEEKKSNWVFFVLFGVCSAYTHYFSLVSTGIVYGILFLAILIRDRRKLLPWFLASLMTALLYLPWLKSFVEQLVYKVNNEYWISGITSETIVEYICTVFGVKGLPTYTEEGLSLSVIVLPLVYLVAFVLLLKNRGWKDTLLGLCILAVPGGTVVVGVLASILVRPVFVIRYLAPSIPLAAAFLAYALGKTTCKPFLAAAMVLCTAAGVFNYASSMTEEYAIPENALDSRFVAAHADADCYVVMTQSSHPGAVLAYYDTQKNVYSAHSFADNAAANPFTNAFTLADFTPEANSTVVLLLDVGQKPEGQLTELYQAEFLGEIVESENHADAYLLTK